MRHVMHRISVMGICLILIALVGCGKTVTTGDGATAPPTGTPDGGNAKPQPTAQPLPTGTAKTATGCPLPPQDVTWPPPAPQLLSPETGRAATLSAGQTLEMVVPATAQWRLSQAPPPNILNLDAPAGYTDRATHSCIWHFTAKAAGQVTLTYSLSPLCVAGYRCSGTITLVDFDIAVR